MKQTIKICMLIIIFQAILLHADSHQNIDSEVRTDTQDTDVTTQKVALKSENKPKASKKKETDTKPAVKNLPSKTTLFVNGRVNDILVVITDQKNTSFPIPIKAGNQYAYSHQVQSIKKVVCYEVSAPNTTLNQADLNTYTAFIFNTDQKLEKYHFINIQQKNAALKRAQESKNESLFHEVCEHNIYNP